MVDQRTRLKERIAHRIVWAQAKPWEREYARDLAISIVDDLYRAPAEGKAVERALKDIEKNVS